MADKVNTDPAENLIFGTPSTEDNGQRKRQRSDTSEQTGVSPDVKKLFEDRSKVAMPADDASELEWNKTLFMKVDEMFVNYDKMCENYSKISEDYNELKKSAEFFEEKLAKCDEEMSDMRREVNNLKTQVITLERQNTELNVQCQMLTDSHVKTEIHRREQNVVFDGVPETYGEDAGLLHHKIVNILNHMMIFNRQGSTVPIAREHRVGPYIKGKTRPVVCHFARHYDAEIVLKNRSQLPDKVYAREDYPSEIEDRRRILRPIFNKAKKTNEFKGKCKLVQDKLVLDGKVYTVSPFNNLDQLPTSLNPRNAAERSNQNVHVFFTQGSPFSNFHPSPFVKDYTDYACNEQYLQAKKAELFNDDYCRTRIMQTTNPFEMKFHGSKVKNVDRQKWEHHARAIALDGCIAKFAQNPNLLDALMSTGNKVIGEASKDPLWGTGKSLDDGDVLDPSSWFGTNLLGQILMSVRERFQ